MLIYRSLLFNLTSMNKLHKFNRQRQIDILVYKIIKAITVAFTVRQSE